MKALSQFSLPYKGLGIGLHQYQFRIGNDFFARYEDSTIKEGTFDVNVTLDKRSDHCIIDFEISGHTPTTCDRCLADIKLPISGIYQLHIKFSDDEYEESDDEIIYMNPDTSTLDLEPYIYEFTNLSMPIVNTYDCDPEVDCDTYVLDKMSGDIEEENESEENKSIWDSLKDLDLE